MPAFFGGALSLGFFVFRQKTQGGAVRTLPVFLDFCNSILGGKCPPFFEGVFCSFLFVVRKNAHTPGHLPSFCEFRGHFCECLCIFRCLFFVFWRPRHFAWTLLTQVGAFFLRLGAQGHNVMKPVSQGTFNVRFERIQGAVLGPFWM